MHPKGCSKTQQKIRSTSTHLIALNSRGGGGRRITRCFYIKIANHKSKHQTLTMGTLAQRNLGVWARAKASEPHRATQARMVWSNVHFFIYWEKQSNKLGYCREPAVSAPSSDACCSGVVEQPRLSPGCSGATSLTGPHQSCCPPKPETPVPERSPGFLTASPGWRSQSPHAYNLLCSRSPGWPRKIAFPFSSQQLSSTQKIES